MDSSFPKIKLMKKWFLIAALFVGYSSHSQAAIMIDPYIGYEMGSGKDNSVSSSFSTKAVNVGARLGWLTDSGTTFVGVDYNTLFDGSVDYEGDSRDAFNKAIIMATALYNFQNNPYRIYAGVGVDTWTIKNSNHSKLSGMAYKVGLGYTRYKPVTINFEYIVESFKKASDDAHSDVDADISNNAMMLNVSWPIKF